MSDSPMKRWMAAREQRKQAAPASPNLSNASLPLDDLDVDEPSAFSLDRPTGVSVSIPNANQGPTAFTRMAVTLKRQRKFSPDSERDLDVFAQTLNPQEHALLQFAATLEVRDILKAMVKDDEWSISVALDASIINYSQAYVLCSTCSLYSDGSAVAVYEAMKALNIQDLPDEKYPQRVQTVISTIGKKLNTARNNLKNKLADSVKPESKIRNVAHLAKALCTKATTPKITVQFYIRLAFLRWQYTMYSSVGNSFWPKVDESMKAWLKTYKTASELDEAYNDVYREDKKTYGDPANSGITATSIKDVPAWQTVLAEYAKAARAPATSAAQVTSAGSSTKRKRADTDEDGDDSGSGGADSGGDGAGNEAGNEAGQRQ